MKFFIKELQEDQIYLSLEGENLKIKYDSLNLPVEIIEKIKRHKEDLVDYLKKEQEGKKINKAPESLDGYPLSSSQYRLWILNHFKEASIAYHMPSTTKLDRGYNIDFLIKAINAVVDRHEILRTVFKKNEQNEIRQWVLSREEIGFNVPNQNLEHKDDALAFIEDFVANDNARLFNLEKGPLIRIELFQLESEYVLYCNMHHIISDDWSKEILVKEILEFYQSYIENREANLPELKIQYKDFSFWQQNHKVNSATEIDQEYWKNVLGGELPKMDFPSQKPRPKNKTYKGKSITRVLSKDVTNKLRYYVEQEKSSLFIGLLTIWKILYYRYTNQKDVLIGIPTTGRTHKELEGQLGFYLNTLLLRNTVNPDKTFKHFFEEVKKNTITAYGHQSYPFDEIINDLGVKRDTSRSPLFDILIDFHNTDLYDYSITENESIIEESIKFDIEYHFIETSETIAIQAKYNTDLYDQAIITQFLDHFKTLSELIIEKQETPIESLEFISVLEKDTLKVLSQGSIEECFPKNCIDAFIKQVEQSPDSIALQLTNKTFTYDQLDKLSNQLAYGLKKEYEVKTRDVVAIHLDQQESTIISLLAILKLDATYVYIEPELPVHRKEFILEDSEAKLLITCTEYMFDIPDFSGDIFAIDVEFDSSWDTTLINSISSGETPAYLIYTSGSTGTPKGVVVSHNSLINYLGWAKDYYSDNNVIDLNFGLFTTLAFDLTVTSLFLPLISGNTLTICETNGNVSEVLEAYLKSNITCIKLTPAHISVLKSLDIKTSALSVAVIGGEALQHHHIDVLKKINPKIRVYNEYGPTEATVGCVVQEVTDQKEVITIGKPIANTDSYVLNSTLNLQPYEVEGELYIGGKGLALGYKNKEELTKSKFIDNPFSPGEKLYKTGDIVKWLPTGEIQYIGRSDDQVKVKGFRIELGEVEFRIRQKETIKDVTVIIQTNQNKEKELAAYIVSEIEEKSSDIRRFLLDKLPEYMVPAHFFQLEFLPLNINGKIDKKALADNAIDKIETGAVYEAPNSDEEEIMVEIWKSEFKVDTLGINDNFFDLGGDSIRAIRILGKINEKLKVAYEIADVFEYPTIKELVRILNDRLINTQQTLIRSEISEKFLSIEEELHEIEGVETIYPMSDIEIGMYYTSLYYENEGVYHDQFTYPIQIKNFDQDIFLNALKCMVEKHDILRTAYNVSDFSVPVHVIFNEIDLPVSFENLSLLSKKEKEKHINLFMENERTENAFKMEEAGLWRMKIFKISEEEHLLIFQFHHAILDGWSRASLITELNNIYFELTKNKNFTPEKLEISYKDYVIEQELLKKDDAVYDFWKNELEGYQRLEIFENEQEVEHYHLTIKDEEYQKLNQYCKHNNTSIRVINFAAYLYSLSRLNFGSDITSGLVVNGRSVAEGGDKVLGCFLNTTPFRIDIKGDSVKRFIEKVERQLKNQKRYESLSLFELSKTFLTETGHENPFFDSLFNYIDFHIYDQAYLGEEISTEPTEFSASMFEEGNTFLDVHVSPSANSFDIRWSRSRKLKSGLSNKDISNYHKAFLNSVIENADKELTEIDYFSHEEKNLLEEFNNTNVKYPKEHTILDLFEKQVKSTPDKIAIVYTDTEITFKELDKKSNQLCLYLQSNYKIKKNDFVALQLGRSEWMLISILAVLKSGAAYVPIAIDFPEDRIDFIKKDCNAKVCIDSLEIEKFVTSISLYPTQPLEGIKVKPNDFAYVIYTSGSTGQPKGVINHHEGLLNRLLWMKDKLGIDENEIILQKTPYTFDVSVWELILPLISGCKLVFAKEDGHKDPEYLQSIIETQKITVVHFVPAMLEMFLSDVISSKNRSLKHLVCSGEALSGKLVNKIKKHLTQTNIYNLYGPTEAAIDVTFKDVTNIEIHHENISIGKPVPNTNIYITNELLEPLPIGVPGELVIGGVQVANGYLNRKELTKTKFLESPFIKGENLYKSGDMARWLPNGDIEFLGRIDYQVKIRGNRIELGEIEKALIAMERIETSIVIASDNETFGKQLVAYFIAKEELNSIEITEFLKKSLPEYMIPSYYIQLEEFPKTVSGKVDRKLLPSVDGNQINSGVEFVAPVDTIENELVEIWATILNLSKDEVGVQTGFFQMGGNSLNILKLRSEIQKKYNLSISMAKLFQSTTIKLQSQMIIKQQSHSDSSPKTLNDIEKTEKNKKTTDDNRIAIIGAAVKIPGANSINEFWENLKNGVESLSHFDVEELRENGVPDDLLLDKSYIRSNGYMKDRGYFDSAFFNYLPDEAKIMDPQTRLLHETVWSGLEDSGYDPYSYEGDIGLYAGARSNIDWQAYSMMINEGKINDFTAGFLRDKDFACSLVAHKLNLKGPVSSISTACSTSLVAVHKACKGILAGDCQMAVAGGVTIASSKKTGYMHQEGMIFSEDGHNRAFDANSSGTVSGEGAGVVVLKKMSEAVKDGDHIIAVIRGSAINNDGTRKVGYTAPSIDGQIGVIKKAQKDAKVAPEQISYIEAHGTATKLGDPIEIEALTQVFGIKNNGDHCGVGTVKSNVGHLDSAAGITGLIKTILCLQNKVLVPSLHYNTPNPEIDFENTPFYVNTELKTWEPETGTLIAGVSSFGIGGTNAHVVLEEAPCRDTPVTKEQYRLINLSAKTTKALERQIDNLTMFLSDNFENINVDQIAWTLQKGRAQFSERATIVANSTKNLLEKLQAGNSRFISKTGTPGGKRRVVFMFPGQGSQYTEMAKDLYEKNTYFKEKVDYCFEKIKQLSGINSWELLYNDQTAADTINQTKYAQPILFSIEYALAKLLEYYGVIPDLMIGHSLGEYVAACLSEVISLDDAIKIVIHRGELIQSLPKGEMLKVDLSEKEIQPYVRDGVKIAGVNTPNSCVLSGNEGEIVQMEKLFNENDIATARLHTSHAFHSDMMLPIVPEFNKIISEIEIRTPKIPYYSNVTGNLVSEKEISNKLYWGEHIINTVRFSEAVNKVISQDNTIYIEVGPGRTLTNFIHQHNVVKKHSYNTVNLVRHPKEKVSDQLYFLEGIGKLWIEGISINWDTFNDKIINRKISLPTYPFEKVKYPLGQNIYEMYKNIALNSESSNPIGFSEEYSEDFKEVQNEEDADNKNLIAENLTQTERDISNLLENFFGVSGIMLDDDFFVMGGDSLKAMSFINQLNRSLSLNITLSDFFEHPTIRELAMFIDNRTWLTKEVETDNQMTI